MRKLLFVFGLASLFSTRLFAQDLQVVLHEDMLNEFLAAVGEVSGGGKFKKAFIKTDYTWTVRNARIDLEPNNATFRAQADIKAKRVKFTEKVTGSVDVKYDPARNVISVKVREAKFDVEIFGVKVATIDLAEYYRPKFEFNGPQPIQKSVTVDLPGGEKKQISVTAVSHNLKVAKDRILVASDLVFQG